jgi:hypothetical protein
MRISTVVFVLKGGKYSLRYLYRKELSEKYEIYRRTKLNATFLMKITLGFSPPPPPASKRGNKVTLTPPPVFEGDFFNLFNSKVKCQGKFMPLMYFIILGIMQDYIPKML